MSLANQKGGFNVTLRVEQTSNNESMCVLEKPLLKKAENWSLQVTDMLVNKTPVLNRQLTEQLRIVPFEANLPDGFRPSDYIFTPQKCYTVCEYVVQLQIFFHKFSFLFWKYGLVGVRGIPDLLQIFIDAEDIATTGVNYTRSNIVPDLASIESLQVGRYLEGQEPFGDEVGSVVVWPGAGVPDVRDTVLAEEPSRVALCHV